MLLSAMESAADLSLTLECGRISYAPKEALPGLFTMAMDTEAALREYLHLDYHLPVVAASVRWPMPLTLSRRLRRGFERS